MHETKADSASRYKSIAILIIDYTTMLIQLLTLKMKQTSYKVNAPSDRVSENILKHGRHIVGVPSRECNEPHLFYTIGNSKTSSVAVEFLCFWRNDAGAKVINSVAEVLSNQQEIYADLLINGITSIAGLLKNGQKIHLRLLSEKSERDAREYYAYKLDNPKYARHIAPHKLIQIILPDDNGELNLMLL